MDAPPAKRRRTSPRLAGRASQDAPPASTTPPDPPLPLHASAAAAGAAAKGAGVAGSALSLPRPPSFASPTRASLARHNPAILERRQSAPRSQGPSGADNGNNDDDDDVEAMLDAQLSHSSAERERAENTRPLARPPIRSPIRPSRSPSRSPARSPARSPSRSPTRRLFGSMFSMPAQHSPEAGKRRREGSLAGSLLDELPRRSPMKPVPRPLPPPDPQRSEDILGPLLAHDRRRSGLDLFRVHDDPPPEPELPPTPEHPDPALTLSPPGIHHPSSTPSKRPKRAATLRKRGSAASSSGVVSSSSPLKQPPLKPAAAATSEGPSKHQRALRSALLAGKANALQERSANTPTTERSRRAPKTSAARGVQPPDPDAAKKKERDAVLAEISGLEADLALAEAATAWLRGVTEESSMLPPPPPPNPRDVVSLLRRRALPATEDAEDTTADATANWLQAATNPIAFLPFGKPRADAAELFPLVRGLSSKDEEDALPLPVSHHPIPMTAAEELPFLQAFTPLAFRSQVVVLPSEQHDTASTAPLSQKHIITATSTTPPGLFLARIEMTVNTKSLRITDLHVPRIDPPEAAAELQPLLDRVTGSANAANSRGGSSGSGGSGLVRNVTVLTWALGEWVRVAVRRAKFWAALAGLLRDKGAGLSESIQGLRTRQKRRYRRRASQRGEDDDQDGSDDGSPAPDRPPRITHAALLAHLGRTAMDVDVPTSLSASHGSVRIEWAIQFDWTGEARSQIGLLVGVPGKWRKADTRGRLAKLPRLFDQLVQGGGDPLTAVETVVALLAGEDGA